MVSESKMREILFRGKRICEKKNWVEGCLLNLDADSGHVFIVPFFNGASTMPVSRIVECTSNYVNPETVGQFTGLTDQYGAKIWEGDIIRYMNDDEISIGVIRFGEYQDFNIGFNIEWLSPNAVDLYRRDIRFWTVCREITVIGNIHDNPELLEVHHV